MKERPPNVRKARQNRSGSYANVTLRQAASDELKLKLEQAFDDQLVQPYLFRLFITGTTPASARAVEHVRDACEEHLAGRYRLDVIDIYQKPSCAREEQIIATPTLIRREPLPMRRYIGDLSKVTDSFFIGISSGES